MPQSGRVDVDVVSMLLTVLASIVVSSIVKFPSFVPFLTAFTIVFLTSAAMVCSWPLINSNTPSTITLPSLNVIDLTPMKMSFNDERLITSPICFSTSFFKSPYSEEPVFVNDGFQFAPPIMVNLSVTCKFGTVGEDEIVTAIEVCEDGDVTVTNTEDTTSVDWAITEDVGSIIVVTTDVCLIDMTGVICIVTAVIASSDDVSISNIE